jgi:hypothetical protein
MDDTKLFDTLRKVDLVLSWLLRGGLALLVFSSLTVWIVYSLLS